MTNARPLRIQSTSAASDGAYVAIHDVADILTPHNFRLIGGAAVFLHQMRLGLGHLPARATADADFGVPPIVLQDGTVAHAISQLGYDKVAGNRWTRRVDDHRSASCDLLVPSYTSHARPTVRVGDTITTEVPGLAIALKREATVVDVEAELTSGETIGFAAQIPDTPSMLALKLHAISVRDEPRDAIDLYTCLESVVAANATNVFAGDSDFTDERPLLAATLHGDDATAARIILDRFPTGDHPRIRTRLRGLVAALT